MKFPRLAKTLFHVIAMAGLAACSGSSTTVVGRQGMSEIQKICSRAYTGRQGAHDKAMQALTDDQQKQVTPLPDRDRFIEYCSQLSEDAARCLDPNIFVVDVEACKKAFNAASKEKLDAVTRLLGGLDPEEPKAEAPKTEPSGDPASQQPEATGEAPGGAKAAQQ